MLRQGLNEVRINGILSEVNIKYGKYQSEGKDVSTIGGNIKIREKRADGEVLEIPVHLFSKKYKNDGGMNPAFESIETVMNDFVSIAACGSEEEATPIAITNGSIRENAFIDVRSGKLVSTPRVECNFINKAFIREGEEFEHKASFSAETLIRNIKDEMDSDGMPTGTVLIDGIIFGYRGVANAVTFTAKSPSVINIIKNNWKSGDTVRLMGVVNFTSVTTTVKEEIEVDFGEPEIIEKSFTNRVNELIITGGNKAPLMDDQAYNVEEAKEALAVRDKRLQDRKEASAVKSKSTPTQAEDLGF